MLIISEFLIYHRNKIQPTSKNVVVNPIIHMVFI